MAHGSPVQPRQGQPQRGQPLRVVQQGHGLRVLGAEEPHIPNPLGGEIRPDALQAGKETGQQVLLFQPHVFVLREHVIAHVKDVVAAEGLGRHEMGVLHQDEEGEPLPFGNVVPVVALGVEDPVQGQHQGDRGQVGQVPAPGAGLLRLQLGHQAGQVGRPQGEQNPVEAAVFRGGAHREAALGVGFHRLDGGAQAHLHALLPKQRHHLVGQGLEAALVSAQPGRAGVDAGPEPGHVHLLVVGAEFPFQQGFPQRAVRPWPQIAPQPLVRGHPFQGLPAGRQPQVQGDQGQAHLVGPGKSGEAEHRGGRIEGIEGACVINHGEGPGEAHLVAQPHFV